jgi:hypothetical protein
MTRTALKDWNFKVKQRAIDLSNSNFGFSVDSRLLMEVDFA